MPAARAAETAHLNPGTRVLIDGAQATGQIPDINVATIGCDYYIGSGHKWLCGPSGTAFCYVSPAALPEFHPYPLSHHGPWPDHEPTPNETVASRLEVGTPNVASLVGLGAALKLWNTIGSEARSHVTALATRLKEGAVSIPGEAFTDLSIAGMFY